MLREELICCAWPRVIWALAAFSTTRSYPPSPAHLTFLLSLFHEALFDNEQDFVHLKTTFASTPSLIVLCEPSCFFQEDQEAT